MEKTGFIYLWYDRKRKMYYIGSHLGTEDDGYICSSRRMRDAYRRRPQDFKRRIIVKEIERNKLLDEEQKWLNLIPDEKLGEKYYNLRKHKFGHWSSDYNKWQNALDKMKEVLSRPEVRKKISLSKVGFRHTEEAKQKIREKRAFQVYTTETKMKISEAHKGKNNYFYGKKHSAESKEKMKTSHIGKKMSEETRQKMSIAQKERRQTERKT